MSPNETIAKIRKAHPVKFKQMTKLEQQALLDYVMLAGKADRETVEAAYKEVAKARRKFEKATADFGRMDSMVPEQRPEWSQFFNPPVRF